MNTLGSAGGGQCFVGTGKESALEIHGKGAVDEVEVLAFEPDRLIRVRWSDGS